MTRTPMGYRFILLIIRPFVWVYNRTMVMFLCFYAIYGLIYTVFIVGFLCDYMCKNYYTAETQKVGLQMLLVPFTVPSYLTNIGLIFNSWDQVRDKEFLETFVTVFLCQSFYVDCLNSLWQFSRRYLKPTRGYDKSKSLRGGGDVSPKDVKFMRDLAKELPPSTPQSAGNNITLPPTIQMDQNNLPSRSINSVQNYNTVALK
eukprot:467103_1